MVAWWESQDYGWATSHNYITGDYSWATSHNYITGDYGWATSHNYLTGDYGWATSTKNPSKKPKGKSKMGSYTSSGHASGGQSIYRCRVCIGTGFS